MNFTKITIIILFLISIFIIPASAELSNTSNYSHYTYTTVFSSSIIDSYYQYSMPYTFHINFSKYNDVSRYVATSCGTLGGTANFTQNFNLTYSGDIVANGSVYVNKSADSHIIMDYTFNYWNNSFISAHPSMTRLVFSYDDSSLFNTISHTFIVSMKRACKVYTHSFNPDIYLGSITYDDYYIGQIDTPNQKIIYDSIIGESLTEPTPESWIQFENTPFLEYDNAIVNFSVEKIMETYPDKRIFLEIATPKITDPYFNYVAYELSDYTGYRGLAIEGKHPIYDAYHNCTAYLRVYESDMSNYETLLEIEESVLTDNHTLLKYTGYDYPTNKSYITGSCIGIDVDIMDYIETDFLYWPDEHFLLHVDAFSNSNQGNREYEYHIDPKYWNADRYFVKHFSCDVWNIINSDFNSTIESYITVYRLGNTTRLTPTIYTNTYADGYIPPNESGYIPPDIPEEPEEPEIPDPDPEPEPDSDYPIPPEQPNGTGANQTVNVSWTGEYYIIVNNTVGSLGSPVYNFTKWTLSPINNLNSSIGEFNYYMNESFTQTAEDSSILYESINTIYDAIHPKIRNVITYYLIWVVLLIILKKD